MVVCKHGTMIRSRPFKMRLAQEGKRLRTFPRLSSCCGYFENNPRFSGVQNRNAEGKRRRYYLNA